MSENQWAGLQEGPRTRGDDMAGSTAPQMVPQHTSDGEASGNSVADPNAKSYDSAPCHMDYSCDMGHDGTF
jgi:hypothetical protein